MRGFLKRMFTSREKAGAATSSTLPDVAKEKHTGSPNEALPSMVLGSRGEMVRSLAFSPDNKMLASTGLKAVNLWDVATRKLVRTIYDRSVVNMLAFSVDGTMLAGAVWEGTRLWNVQTGRVEDTLPAGYKSNHVMAVNFSPDGKLMASGDGRIWDLKTHQPVAELHIFVEALAFSPDGSLLATGPSPSSGWLDHIEIRSLASGVLLRALKGPTSTHFAVAFSPDGKTLMDGRRRQDTTTGPVKSLGYFEVRLWDVDTGELRGAFQQQHSAYEPEVAFCPNGSLVASGGGKTDVTVKLWAIQSGRLLVSFEGHNDQIMAIAFSTDGGTLASGDRQGSVRLWNLANLK